MGRFTIGKSEIGKGEIKKKKRDLVTLIAEVLNLVILLGLTVWTFVSDKTLEYWLLLICIILLNILAALHTLKNK